MLFYLALDIVTGNCSIIQLKALVHTGKNSSCVSHLYAFLVELLLMFGIQHPTRSFPFNEYNVSCCLALLMRNNKKQWVDNQEIRRSFILWTCLGAIRQPKLFVLPLTEIVNHTNDVSDTCFIPIYCRVANALQGALTEECVFLTTSWVHFVLSAIHFSSCDELHIYLGLKELEHFIQHHIWHLIYYRPAHVTHKIQLACVNAIYKILQMAMKKLDTRSDLIWFLTRNHLLTRVVLGMDAKKQADWFQLLKYHCNVENNVFAGLSLIMQLLDGLRRGSNNNNNKTELVDISRVETKLSGLLCEALECIVSPTAAAAAACSLKTTTTM